VLDEAVGRIVTCVVVEGPRGGRPAGDHSGDEGGEIYGSWLSSRHPAAWAGEISLASYLTWRYGHIFMFGRLAAMGAGLHIRRRERTAHADYEDDAAASGAA
jgi:hypothetical protein